MVKRPLILVCNDDGIFAPGIEALTSVMQELGDVLVVAPDSPQSGMGHAITINSTLRVHRISHSDRLTQYSCSGTPVDCIKMAVSKLSERPIALIVSGINHGSNSSINVIYSGTMSAAVEGCIEGIPSIGFSLCNYSYDADFSSCLSYVKRIAELVLKNGLPEGICLNVNIPSIHISKIQGVRVSRQAKAFWDEELDERTDPRGGKYYWLTGIFKNMDDGIDTDEWALANNFISLVPIQIDITAHHTIESLKMWDFSIPDNT
ncbi:MAG: 5'/3'-nucleotidase SurE [Flavobacteriales bacterium]|nr:5'/3'-nucleotidase SurE [Flavobacteriales bacterium]MCZ2444056.1 5'/3'-nucleotidase SurE [Flavobacteriales bacterium]